MKEKIENIIMKLLDEHTVPSIQIAVYSDNKVIMCEGFGYKDVENQEKADSKTLYAIGSITKSFTATALAILVDSKKIKWDDPVKKYLPEFEMYDDYVTHNLTIRDMCSHRCGLPRHEETWYLNDDISLEEIIKKLKYLKPNVPFRYTFQYQNHMYALAGYLIERVSGQKWYRFIEEKITMPLGMLNTSFKLENLINSENKALPYEGENKIMKVKYKNIDNIGAAGSINSNVEDMIKWIIFNINKGKYNNRQVVSSNNLKECHSPQTIIKKLHSWESNDLKLHTYGMGWVIEMYRGHIVIHHNGGIDGFSSLTSFIPEKNFGFIILTNSGTTIAPEILQNRIYDIVLGLDEIDWNSKILNSTNYEKELALKEKNRILQKVNKNKIKEISLYEGEYENLAYGKVKIYIEKNYLVLKYGCITGKIEHLYCDNFLFIGNNELFFTVQFKSNKHGRINCVDIKFESGLNEPITFKRVD